MFFKTLERIRSIAVRHSGKSYTPEGLTHLIRMQFRDAQLQFTTEKDTQVIANNFLIKGEYRPLDDEHNEPCITISLTFSKKQRRVCINDIDWHNIGFHIADVVTHEYLHRYYCRQRGYQYGRGYSTWKLNSSYYESMKEYLGCEDEIQAHGFNVASEMVVFNKPLEKTKTYRLYQRHFKDDQKVVLQLKRQAVKYIKRLERCDEQIISRSRARNAGHL